MMDPRWCSTSPSASAFSAWKLAVDSAPSSLSNDGRFASTMDSETEVTGFLFPAAPTGSVGDPPAASLSGFAISGHLVSGFNIDNWSPLAPVLGCLAPNFARAFSLALEAAAAPACRSVREMWSSFFFAP